MMKIDLEKIIHIVRSTAQSELLPLFSNVERHYKADGSVITQADDAVQASIEQQLQRLYPDIKMLGEEMTEEEQLAALNSGEAIWCLDPLDGTNNFSAGIPYFSISLALLIDEQVVMGIVYDPTRDEMFAADEMTGARLNGQQIVLDDCGLVLKKSIAIIDFKRLDANLAGKLVSKPPYSSQRSFGSVALDWCWLAVQRSHVYLHGRSNIWDYAAGQYIFSRAGGLSATLQGEPVFIRKLEKRSAVAAVDQSLFQAWAGWIGQVSE